MNTPEIYQSARKFALDNPSAPSLYRAWLKAEVLAWEKKNLAGTKDYVMKR